MAFTAPTIQQFQAQFIRDFPYGTDPNTAVLDQDILNAFILVDNTINQGLWATQSIYQQMYGYLAAHFLVLNLRASSQGLSGKWSWLETGKSVGPASSSFQIPQRIIDNPDFAAYMSTYYGAMYLNMLWPQLVGNVFAVCGTTQP